MRPWTLIAALALLLAAVSWAWSTLAMSNANGVRNSLASLPSARPASNPREVAEYEVGSLVGQPSSFGAARQTVSVDVCSADRATSTATSRIPSRPRVRVVGRVRREGVPVAYYDLVIHSVENGVTGEEVDWDYTDDEGCFGVSLAEGCYEFRDAFAQTWVFDIVAAAGDTSQEIQLDLY